MVSSRYYFTTGLIMYAMKNDISNAESHFKKSIQENNYYYAAYQNLAYFYLSNNKLDESRQFIKRSLQKFPKSSLLWYYLAEAEYKLGNKKGAIDSALQAYLILKDKYSYNFYLNLLTDKPFK